jgi:hypothetical protein
MFWPKLYVNFRRNKKSLRERSNVQITNGEMMRKVNWKLSMKFFLFPSPYHRQQHRHKLWFKSESPLPQFYQINANVFLLSQNSPLRNFQVQPFPCFPPRTPLWVSALFRAARNFKLEFQCSSLKHARWKTLHISCVISISIVIKNLFRMLLLLFWGPRRCSAMQKIAFLVFWTVRIELSHQDLFMTAGRQSSAFKWWGFPRILWD